MSGSWWWPGDASEPHNFSLSAAGTSADRTNLGDLIVSPLVIAWGDGALRTAASVEFVLPTGQYDSHALLNTGKNYYTARAPCICSVVVAERQGRGLCQNDVQLQLTERRHALPFGPAFPHRLFVPAMR
nr:transporter [Cupriavidus lacunae]